MIRQAQSLLSAYGEENKNGQAFAVDETDRIQQQQHIETHNENQQNESHYPFNWIGSLIGLMVAGKQSWWVAERSGPLSGQLTSAQKGCGVAPSSMIRE